MKQIQLLALALGATLAVTATAQDNFHYSAIVTDAEGRPVPGASVEFWQKETRDFNSRTEKRQSTVSDANGAFELVLSKNTLGQIIVSKPGLAPLWKCQPQFTSPDEIERLVLTVPTTAAGIVVDDADKPVANAQVFVTMAYTRALTAGGQTLEYFSSGEWAKTNLSARSGADGRFRIEGFPTNTFANLGVIQPGKVMRQIESEQLGPETMMCRSGQKDIKLILDPAGSVEGRIVAEQGSVPFTQVRLLLNPDSFRNFVTDDSFYCATNGSFTFSSAAPGSYHLFAIFGTNALTDWVAESVPVTVVAGETTRDVQLKAIKGGILEATVVSSVDHKPITGVQVSARVQNYLTSATTGSNGIAVLRLPPGEFHVSAYREGSQENGVGTKIEPGQTNRVQIEMTPPPTITGRVLNADGTPAAGLPVAVMPNFFMHGMRCSTITDTNGQYEVEWRKMSFGSSPPNYCILARDLSRNLAAVQEIDESVTNVDLRLAPGQTLAGRVEDANGKPLTNAVVQVSLQTGNMGARFDKGKIKIDAQGRFEAVALPPDRKYGLWVTAKGYGSASSFNLQDPGDRIDVPTLILKRADKKIAGRVVDADGKPASGVSIFAHGQGQPQISEIADQDGQFSFDACEGSVQVSVHSQRSRGNAHAQAGDTNVVITLGAAQVFPGSPARQERRSLTGSRLPNLATIGFSSDVAPTNKPILLCLFDVEQRPSRRFVTQLKEQYDALRQKGITLLGAQATITSTNTLQEWKTANPVPFPVGSVAEKSPQTKWVLDLESLPWLILTDGQGRVTAEGFGLDELDTKLKPK